VGKSGQDDGIARNGCIRTIALYFDIHRTFRLRATGAPRTAARGPRAHRCGWRAEAPRVAGVCAGVDYGRDA
jgi:hypothetical protein